MPESALFLLAAGTPAFLLFDVISLGLVIAATNSTDLSFFALFLQLFGRFVLKLSNFFHSQLDPLVDPTKDFTMELEEQARVSLLDFPLNLVLETEPFEGDATDLVATHDRIVVGFPVSR